jgi:hypothetical protein
VDESNEMFDALCAATVYYWADCAHKVTRKNIRLLREAGLDFKDGRAIYDRYRETLKELVEPHIAPGWEWTHDYWGAECLAFEPGRRSIKGGTRFAGDASGRVMLFASYAALKRYVEEFENESKEEIWGICNKGRQRV